MNRLEATRLVVASLHHEPVIASLGHPAYDLFACGDRAENFYTWGSMGVTSSIALGLALARPDQRVVAIDGDGSLLMNLGSLATIAACRPANLVVVVMDNACYGTTGGQETFTAGGANLEEAARALGIGAAVTVRTADELDGALAECRRSPGPWVIVARVTESAPMAKPPLDCVFIKQRFMAAIGNAEPGTQGTAG
ncbi:MAG: aldehyde dehydrogenase [Planctomycetes bacterium]|nr:aldehyde dehydrogenase [Planctomycetota bacterium]